METGNSDEFAASGFNDKSIRQAFIARVYTILSAQLLVTMGIVSVFLFVEPVKTWVQQNRWCYFVSIGLFFVTYLALACCSKVRRRFPGNFIALAIFTLAFSYMAGTITSIYTINSVVVCLSITTAVTMTVSFIAACCPCDITKCWALLAIFSVLFMIFGLICTLVHIFAGYNATLQAVYGGIAGVLFTFYLAYDTQMILGGRKYEMNPEEYIFGALQLYVDIMQIFLAVLTLFGTRD